MKAELKEIAIDKILANFYQPREQFEKEKIKELAESILSNGLINPITVRKWKNKFMIVAGERRWRACKIAKLKTITSFVKEYKSEGDLMTESLIENVHREDLKDMEKAKFLNRIKEMENLNNVQLAKRVRITEARIRQLLALIEPSSRHISKAVEEGKITEHHFRAIKTIGNKEIEKKVLNKVKKKDLSTTKTEKLARAVKKAPEEVKEALLSDEIDTEQAERISKLKTEPQRKKAIQEHKNIATVGKSVEKNIEKGLTTKEKREIDKKLIKAKNFILSFRNSITDCNSNIEKTIKTLMFCVPFIPIMDEKQRNDLDTQLGRFIEVLTRGTQIAEQIKNKLEY